MNWNNDRTWVSDENGNKCSVAYFGSEKAAEEALTSLVECRDCVDCSDCSDCSDCTDCTRCTRCSGCSGCSECSRCSDCSDCSYCSDCTRCSGCSECSRCTRCTDCTRCTRCTRCSNGEKKAETVDIPKIPSIDKAVYTAASADGALEMSNWHEDGFCGTTHCRAGWVTHLAGEAGKALEEWFNTELAAMLIYRESGSPINPARFYDSNEDAVADMKARAGL